MSWELENHKINNLDLRQKLDPTSYSSQLAVFLNDLPICSKPSPLQEPILDLALKPKQWLESPLSSRFWKVFATQSHLSCCIGETTNKTTKVKICATFMISLKALRCDVLLLNYSHEKNPIFQVMQCSFQCVVDAPQHVRREHITAQLKPSNDNTNIICTSTSNGLLY